MHICGLSRGIGEALTYHISMHSMDLAATTFPLLLKQMYDEDLIDEEVLLLWAGSEERDEYVDAKVSEEKRLALRAASTAFIAWLEEAESESEEE